jgi:hypothetical protein
MFASDISGQWLIQFISDEAGTCKLINNGIPKNQTLTLNPDTNDYVPWIKVEKEEMITPTNNNLKIDCSSLTAPPTLSLINKKTASNSKIVDYFIKEEKTNQKIVDIQLGIPCWGPTYRSTCDSEITAYVLLALNKRNKNPDPTWLKERPSLTALQNAILYELTSQSSYLTALETTQATSGYWASSNIHTTSLVNSLIPDSETKNKSSTFIKNQRDSTGCWPKHFCTVKSTAAAIYALGSSTTTTTPDPGDKTILTDCDQKCRDLNGCICPSDCTQTTINNGNTCEGENGDDEPPIGSPCVTPDLCDGQMDAFSMCQDIPGDDCPIPGSVACDYDDICDAAEDGSCLDCDGKPCSTSSGADGTWDFNTGNCEATGGTGGDGGGTDGTGGTDGGAGGSDEDEKSRALFWFLMLIALLLAGGGGAFLAYKKGLIKFKKDTKGKGIAAYTPKLSTKPSSPYKPRTHPRTRKSPVKKFLDKELDRSMDELDKLLKK